MLESNARHHADFYLLINNHIIILFDWKKKKSFSVICDNLATWQTNYTV